MLSLLVLIGLPAVQAQDMQGPSWEMGWVTDVDPKYVVDLEEDWDLTGELVVYVSNDGPATLNLALSYDFDEDGPFSFDGPDNLEVAGNTNDTFTISITGVDAQTVRAFSPSSSLELTVTGEEKVGDSTLRSQEISADITVPRMFRLIPNLIAPTDTLFSGSWVDFTLEVSNLGNTQDAITMGEATVRSCPHLSVTGLEQLENTVVQVTNANGDNAVAFTLRLEASTSHQERTCEVSIAVESEGDESQRSSTINVDVVAPEVSETTNEEEDEEDQPLVPDSSSLPWVSIFDVLTVTLVALLLTRWRRV
ncbi:MAG: hypothetical protein CMB74_01170 [Euryarchaeota archaeon]|nr:hypothetical protein [Euryarchaeota archaeon]|tara:strand:+ start:1039 stop:1962 length:924 start_codon:yes stop_codon:yes gene_type:complete